MERIDAKLLELNTKITQLKEREVIPRQNIEALKSQQYIEEMQIIDITQKIDEINKEIRDLNIARTVLEKMESN